MILVIALLFCSCATLRASEHPSYYLRGFAEPRSAEECLPGGYGDDYDRGNLKYIKSKQNYGDNYEEDYDQRNLRNLQKAEEKYGAEQYRDDQDEYLRDLAHRQAHRSGAEASLHLSGGERGHVSNAHDRGSYEKEKKYGYEKAYGHEKEVRNHDKAAASRGFEKGYNHNENKANFREQESALRDLEKRYRKHKSGSQEQAYKDLLLDLEEKLNRGKKYASKYANEDNEEEKVRFVRQPVRVYKTLKRPVYLKKYLPEGQARYNDYRYSPENYGLGLLGYGNEYQFNPYRNNDLDDIIYADQGAKKPLINNYEQYLRYYPKSS